MFMGHLYAPVGEVSVQVLCPFFKCIVGLPGVESYEFFIYLGDQTRVQYVIGNYVLPYSSLVILAMVSLVVQEHFILI